MLVLPVSERSPYIGRHEGVLSCLLLATSGGVATLVGPGVVEEEEESGECTASLCAHDGNLGGSEIGSVGRLEGLGPDDVAEGEGTADDGGGECTLGGTAEVGGRPGVENGEGGDNGVDEVDTGEAAIAVCRGEEGHEGASKDAGKRLVNMHMWKADEVLRGLHTQG